MPIERIRCREVFWEPGLFWKQHRSPVLRNGPGARAFLPSGAMGGARQYQEWNMKRVWLISVASLALLAGASGAFSQGQGGGGTGATAPSASPSGQGSGSPQGSTTQ